MQIILDCIAPLKSNLYLNVVGEWQHQPSRGLPAEAIPSVMKTTWPRYHLERYACWAGSAGAVKSWWLTQVAFPVMGAVFAVRCDP